MRTRALGWVVVWTAVGCGRVWTESDFIDQYPERICDRAVACNWVEDFEQCVDDRRAVLEQDQLECGDFDSSQVKPCLDEVQALGCEYLEYEDPTVQPVTCRYVFDCTL
jgi:hypothetical protein